MKYAVLATALVASLAIADDEVIDQIEVFGTQDIREFELADRVDIGPDSASLLRKAPGADVNSNGPLTGIAQYRGMYGSRVSVQVNGMCMSSGGPNWMDPPLSYAPAALLESLVVFRGIAPVSAGQETIGGVIDAQTWSGDFASSGTEITGRVRAGGQSINDGTLASGMLVMASDSHRAKVSAFIESGDDAEFPGGKLLPTSYQRERYDVGYGYTSGSHTLQIDYGRNETGDSGTPALPMDIEYIDADIASVRHVYDNDRFNIKSKVYFSDIDHGMTNFHMRQAPANGAMWRRNIATGENTGFTSAVTTNGWIVGIDGHSEVHNSDISNPNNAMFFVVNFNDAERRVLGAFAERNFNVSELISFEVGLRYNNVRMDAGVVDGTPAMMMPPAAALRDAFNAADRTSTDHNLNWVVKLRFDANETVDLFAGAARKSRSPSYQERFLWLPLESTAGLADMRTYTGNLDLDPEVSHEIELGIDIESDRLFISPRVFYRDVHDYIQGTVSSNPAAVMFIDMMNMMNGTNRPPPLEFNNVDATIYGADVDWSYQFNRNWSFDGVISYVRGKRDDIDDNLYRISPFNSLFGINYDTNNWGLTLETHAFAGQDNVSETNAEQATPGHVMFNAMGYWEISEGLRLGFGIDNLTDKKFQNHLGGYNRVMGNPNIAVGERLYGQGRNVFARVDYQW